jgi:CRP-like cAMP-binding protein
MIDNAPLFADLSEAQRAQLAERMVLKAVPSGGTIYAQGQEAIAMYFVGSGRVRLLAAGDIVLANLGQGALFGDTDVLAGRNYSVTAEAAADSALWALTAADLAAATAYDPEIGRKLMVAAGLSTEQAVERHLKRMGLLSGLTGDQVREVAQHLRAKDFAAGQTIYREGAPGDALYIVEEGQVALQTGAGAARRVQLMLGSGEFFGETALLTGEPQATDAVAQTAATIWMLDRADFEALALKYPVLALNLSRALSRRLRQASIPVAAATVAAAAIPAVTAVPAAPRPVSAPVPAPTAVPALGQAAAPATSWWSRSSTGAKLSLIALVLLLIWLVFFVPFFWIRSQSAANPTSAAPNTRVATADRNVDISRRVVLVALAADLPVQTTPTYTPWPTETPLPTPTFTPTATPTETPIPTPTFTPTATPVPPTATPIPPPPPPAPVQAEPAPAVAAVAAKAPPAPSVKYKLIEMRRLTPCENRGNHHIFVTVVDASGAPLDGVTLVQTSRDQIGNVLDKSVSGTKGPGKAEFMMWKMAEYAVYVTEDGSNPASTDIAQPLHSNFTDEANCSDGEGGNTLFHNSFAVTFQKTS